jgi:patatin-like phospholipase/acyl hydrolase
VVYRILSIDGGGIKGVFALQVLKMIEEELGRDILKKIDCFSGTSTGALIVSGMAMGYEPKDLLRFYKFFASRVFPKRKELEDLGKAKYGNEKLKRILSRVFPENPTLSDLSRHIVIPACKLSSEAEGCWYPEVYDNFDREKSKEYSLIDVALRSSAAPIYFPSYQKYIDGGVFALNPSLLAFSRAIDPKGGGIQQSDVRILSLGNGINPAKIEEEIDWDEKRWMQPYGRVALHPLFSLMTDMGAFMPEYPLTQILGDKFCRINGPLPVPVEMDDLTKVGLLIKSAKDFRSNNQEKWGSMISSVEKMFSN